MNSAAIFLHASDAPWPLRCSRRPPSPAAPRQMTWQGMADQSIANCAPMFRLVPWENRTGPPRSSFFLSLLNAVAFISRFADAPIVKVRLVHFFPFFLRALHCTRCVYIWYVHSSQLSSQFRHPDIKCTCCALSVAALFLSFACFFFYPPRV